MAKFGDKVVDKEMFPFPSYALHPSSGMHPIIDARHIEPIVDRPYESIRHLDVNAATQEPMAEFFDAKYLGLEPKSKIRTAG